MNGSLRGHGTLPAVVADFASWSAPVFAAATVAPSLMDRSGCPPRGKPACASALATAALGLRGVRRKPVEFAFRLTNQLLGSLWRLSGRTTRSR